jgi:two-component system sensor histidine kinase PhoQ
LLIEDDGPGIPENTRQNILNRGARADTATSGQGIGLAVSIDIVSSYNGSITVESSRLGGAAFRIKLPVKN